MLAGDCTRVGRIDLEWTWLNRNGVQEMRRKLNIALDTNMSRDNTIALISAEYMHEVKENMTEYIIGKSNISLSSAKAPLTVNLKTRYVYTKDNRTTDLPDSIFRIEHFRILARKIITRSGRTIGANSVSTSTLSTPTNTAGYDMDKSYISMILLLIFYFY